MNDTSRRLFITGNSSGLGRGLAKVYLERGWSVYGISRRGCDLDGGALHDIRADLSDFEAVPVALDHLLRDVDHLDLVILNAGVLGPIKDLHETRIEEIRQVMDINVWSNKVILDWLLDAAIRIDRILFISSGAAVRGNRGWGAYALSKATLNMLAQLYAHEFPDSHLIALAPGLVDTAMQDYLCEQADATRFESLRRLQAARGTGAMPAPEQAAEQIASVIPRLAGHPSGAFVDIRKLPAS